MALVNAVICASISEIGSVERHGNGAGINGINGDGANYQRINMKAKNNVAK
jgi:hypothetical protein